MPATALPILILVASVVAGTAVLVMASRERQRVKTRIIGGMAMRLAGGLIYLFGIGAYYGGGDYLGYEREGERISEFMQRGRWDLVTPYFWRDGQLAWGTEFMYGLSGVIKYVTGADIVVMFLMFSLMGFVGCVLIAQAARRAYGSAAYERILSGMMWFPSLWFWPSSLGKDAIMLLGLGLVTMSMEARTGAARWLGFLAGMVLTFMIRPQVAVVLILAVVAGHVLSSSDGWTAGRLIQAVGALVVLAVALFVASSTLGFSVTDTEEVDEYIDARATATAYGGSAIELAGPGWTLPVQGFATSLFRPYPWDVSGATALISAVEITLFWIWVWRRRAAVGAFFRRRPRTRLFWFGAVFVVVYATTMGMAVANLGTLVRQRAHLFPFLFIAAAALPVPQRRAVGAPAVRLRPAAAPTALQPET